MLKIIEFFGLGHDKHTQPFGVLEVEPRNRSERRKLKKQGVL